MLNMLLLRRIADNALFKDSSTLILQRQQIFFNRKSRQLALIKILQSDRWQGDRL